MENIEAQEKATALAKEYAEQKINMRELCSNLSTLVFKFLAQGKNLLEITAHPKYLEASNYYLSGEDSKAVVIFLNILGIQAGFSEAQHV